MRSCTLSLVKGKQNILKREDKDINNICYKNSSRSGNWDEHWPGSQNIFIPTLPFLKKKKKKKDSEVTEQMLPLFLISMMGS